MVQDIGNGPQMETFTQARELVETDGYAKARTEAIAALDLSAVDGPIVDIVEGFAALPHCFTLQCCYGHFICGPEQDSHSLEPISSDSPGPVRYRIAYVAFCLEYSDGGRTLLRSLAKLPSIDPEYIQFGSADWFWERQANSYALQVEPEAHMLKDEAILEVREALHTQGTRDRFFEELRALLAVHLSEHRIGSQQNEIDPA